MEQSLKGMKWVNDGEKEKKDQVEVG